MMTVYQVAAAANEGKSVTKTTGPTNDANALRLSHWTVTITSCPLTPYTLNVLLTR